MSNFKEDTVPLMRPHQVDAAQSELDRINQMLSAPPHIAGQVQDRGKLIARRRRLEKTMETEAPKPYSPEEKDRAIARRDDLEGDIRQGMPTAAEMRRNPPGTVDKHLRWERTKKQKIMEWKHICARLNAGGDVAERIESEVSNVERLRPVGGPTEGNMHGAAIPGQQFFFPSSGGPNITNLMSDADREALAAETAAIVLAQKAETTEPGKPETRKKRKMSPEARAKAAENLARAREAKAAKAKQPDPAQAED